MEKEVLCPLELLVDAKDAVGAAVSKSGGVLEGWIVEGRTHASCRIPAVARRRGDRPMFEMMLAAALSDFLTPKQPLITRRPQDEEKQPS